MTRPIAIPLLLALFTLAVRAEPAPAPETATLTVKLVGLRNERGLAQVAVFRSARGFPEDYQRAIAGGSPSIRGGVATIRFERLPPGRLAVAAFHDEDGNRELARGLFGRPKEGYGFSRNARAAFGPPDFEDAAFLVPAGRHSTIEIRIRY